jgi:hypothetical protein
MSEDTPPAGESANAGEQLNPKTLAWLRRIHEMRNLTDNHAIQQHWQWWDEKTPGRIDFVIHANVSWETKIDCEVDLGIGWIRPTVFEPVRAGPEFELPFSAAKEYGAGVPIADIEDGDTGRAYELIGRAVDTASFLTNALSFLSGNAAWCRPARVLQIVHGGTPPVFDARAERYKRYIAMPPPHETMSTLVTDDWMKMYAQFASSIWNVRRDDVRRVLLTAVAWQAQANSGAELGRYLHYFASVELLGHFFYENLPRERTARPSDSEIRQRVLEAVLNINGSNYMDQIRKCSETLDVSARAKIRSLGRLVDFDTDVFFQRAQRDGKSLLDIRNDIGHGNTAHDDREYLKANREALDKFQPHSREFVVRVALAAAQGKLDF